MLLTETDRILRLPQRTPSPPESVVEWATSRFFHPHAVMAPRPVQAWALWEMAQARGLFGLISVGWGKTFIAYAAPAALGVERAVILLPSPLVKEYEREVAQYQEWGALPQTAHVTVLSYNTLSRPDFSAVLDDLRPQAIIADEAHKLRNPDAARTRRFLRYMDEHRSTLFVAVSGTMFGTSIRDGAHLSWLALRDGSPLPVPGSGHLSLWSHVLDEGAIPTSAENRFFREVVCPYMGDTNGGGSIRTRARRAIHQRIVRTPGVVSVAESSCTVPLTVREVPLTAPPALQEAAERVRNDWELPGDEGFVDGSVQALEAARNILTGFHYVWDWPDGEPDVDWLSRRATWARALRDELTARADVHYDSPALVTRVLDGDLERDPAFVERSFLHWAWAEWRDQPPPPPVRTVWLDEYLLDDLESRAREMEEPVIVWYSSRAVEERLAARGWDVYGAGSILEGPARNVAASIDVHGTGKNLQAWSRAIVLEPPAGGVKWEQLLARLHRPGQEADEVVWEVYVTGEATAGSVRAARSKAAFLMEIQGQDQRLLEGWEEE